MWNPFAYFKLPSDLPSFLKSQFTPLPYPSHDFSNQTIIITGSNTGLGLEAARHFVRLNANTVILAVRSREKGEVAKRDIEETTGRKDVVQVWELDLADFGSVRTFCKKATEELERIDVVVENAGVATPRYEEFEGMESTIAVNVVGTFLMALLLLPKLREMAGKFGVVPRLTIVSSEAHEQATFQERLSPAIFPAFKNPKYIPDRYNTSKLLEVLVVRELAPLITKSQPQSRSQSDENAPNYKPQIILNTLTPGFCHSELMRSASFPLNLLAWIGKKLIGRTTEMGSRTLVAAAAAGMDSHGMYMVDCEVRVPGKWVRSPEGKETQRRVWAELGVILEGIEGGVLGNV